MSDSEPVTGVTFDPKPGGGPLVSPKAVWRARASVLGVEHTLGRFATVQEANEHMLAYRAALDGMVVRCSKVERQGCRGCQGLRLRFSGRLPL